MRYTVVPAVLSVVCLLAALPVVAGDGAIPIWETTTITEPGQYVVTRSFAGQIIIAADQVDLDLGGFTISGGTPIYAPEEVRGVTVRNGYLQGEEHIQFDAAHDFVIRGLVLLDGEDGLRVSGSRGLVENNFALVEGIHAGGNHITVRNNHVVGAIRVNGDSCRVVGNEVEGSIVIEEGRTGNVVVDNIVTPWYAPGILVGGSNGVVEDNVVIGGINTIHGVFFEDSSSNNVYRGNTARGNNGDPADCANPAATPDFCDEGTGNTSHGDNYMPGQM